MFLKSRDIPAEELDQVEPWFNTKFSETSIPASWAQACKDTSLSSEFHLPLPNLFIAEDLSIREGDFWKLMHFFDTSLLLFVNFMVTKHFFLEIKLSKQLKTT